MLKTTQNRFCDICGDEINEKITPFFIRFGFEYGGNSYGVRIVPSLVGDYKTDICQSCYEKSILQAAKEIVG